MPAIAPSASIERLFARHRLGTVSSVAPLPGGQLNTAFRVGEDYVLRCRAASRSTGSLEREATILPRLRRRAPVPEVVASGNDDLLGEYLIQRWVPGQSLLTAWEGNPDVAVREWWLVQWAAALKAVHEERFPYPGDLPRGSLREFPSWRNYVETRLRKRLDALMRVPGVDRSLLLASERYLRRHAPVLEDGPFCLIHRDLHFANVLVDGPNLAAVLDFELAESGPPDYELDTIYRFLRYPWLFGEAGSAARLTSQRFASVWVRLKRLYPEMFHVPHLRRRLGLYALDHDLSCLLQCYINRSPMRRSDANDASLGHALDRLEEVLNDRYGPD